MKERSMVSYSERDITTSSKEVTIIYFIGVFCGLISGFLLSIPFHISSMDKFRQEAIEANVAKWVIDEKTGERSFRFSE